MKQNYFALNLHLAVECGGWSRNAFRAVLKSQTVSRNVNVKHYHGNCVIFHSQTFSYLNTNFGTYLVAKCRCYKWLMSHIIVGFPSALTCNVLVVYNRTTYFHLSYCHDHKIGWSQTQDSEEKVNKLIYNSKVHRCC